MAEKKSKKTVPKVKNPPQGPNPWDVAPILSQGDTEPEPLWTAVGMSLTAWEKLDQIQSQIFGVLVGSRRGGASAAYGIVIAASTRSEMVGTAAEAVLFDAPELRAEVTSMTNRIGKLGGRRNDIAHGVVSWFRNSATDEFQNTIETDFGHFLIPASYATKKRAPRDSQADTPMSMRGKYAYTAGQIRDYAAAFHDEYTDGVKLLFRLITWVETKWPPTTPQPPEFRPDEYPEATG